MLKIPVLKDRIINVIEDIENSKSLNEIQGIKKLKGDKFSYRIRIGDYRMGIFYENNVVEFVRFVHRKDIYKVFP